MLRLTGRKNGALKMFQEKKNKTRDILKTMNNNDRLIAAAVYAGGNILTIKGCKGLEKVGELLKSIRAFKENGLYKVQFNSRLSGKAVSKEKAEKLFSLFGVSCKENNKNNRDDEERA